ncbi:dUTP diphosphatase [Alkalihalobacillus sp. MEB130]|uniref:dUTP diphosphatase n=1 Tax=Alkalihalobacillus sp. MEB130 TaxID=2976704 RepID=UPI0028E0181A|nr:dUTP diphosphatase [Alkalihalobacillus sp. MEB130]MDT8859444.1 dUTP diphosphatase [Alkalihalobacillus sp. MEB130]
MDIQVLFAIQKDLNDRIVDEHQLAERDLFQEQLLALIVEVSELANETKSFKYWSRKPASKRSIILEEYVDGLHFVLTLGLTLCMTSIEIKKEMNVSTEKTTSLFLTLIQRAYQVEESRTKESYQELVDAFFLLGHHLGFSHEEIEQAYLDKNKVNHERQDSGY